MSETTRPERTTIEIQLFPLWDKMKGKRVPLSFDLEVTARCSADCRHCYINLPAGDPAAKGAEMTAKEILGIARQAADLGVMWCLVTGGEPLLRDDFEEIYLGLKRMGLLVSVFTNACLVTQRHVDLFKKYPPRDIEVTVYGVTRQAYEEVTRRPGSFDAFMRGLDLLFASGVRVRLKAMAIQPNLHEQQAIADFCRARTKDYYRFDPQIHLRFDGDAARNVEVRPPLPLRGGERELQRQLRRALPALLVALGRRDDVRPARGDGRRRVGELRPEGPRPPLTAEGVPRLVPHVRDRQPLPLVSRPRPPRVGDARRHDPRLLCRGARAGGGAEGVRHRTERLSRRARGVDLKGGHDRLAFHGTCGGHGRVRTRSGALVLALTSWAAPVRGEDRPDDDGSRRENGVPCHERERRAGRGYDPQRRWRCFVNLYERDFFAWANEQAALLRSGRLSAADIEHIAEEIESMGKTEKRELVNRLTVLLTHLLKWRHQPERIGVSWRATVRLQRRDLTALLEDNPSLKATLPDSVARAFGNAVIEAGAETGMPETVFPSVCPWSFEQMMDEAFWPEPA